MHMNENNASGMNDDTYIIYGLQDDCIVHEEYNVCLPPHFQPLVDLRGHLDRLVEEEGDGFLAIIILDDRGAVPEDLYTVLLIPIVARPLSQIGALPIGVREYDEVGPVAPSAWTTPVSSGSAISTHQ
jgi:hypothetical protein